MFRNYFTIALRNLQKRKGFSLLNIFGLALGMISCLLILQYVNFERSYDTFHANGENLYRLRLDSYQEGRLAWQSATSYPAFAPTMKRDFPEIEEACRIYDAEFVMSNPQTNIKFAEKKGYFADPAFLKMFTVELLSGDKETALSGPDKIVISESTAQKYFGKPDVLGEQLVVKDPDLFQSYQITGVFKDYPANSHLAIDYLVSYATLSRNVAQVWGDTTNATETSWGWYDYYTYFQLKPGADVESVKARFPAFVDKYVNEKYRTRGLNARNDIDLIPMQAIHLSSNVNQEAEVNGDGKAISVLFLIAIFILVIAWINYVNLSTARSIERAREVGVRKVMGALRPHLVRQFLMESLLLNLAAFSISLVGVMLLMPAFVGFVGKPIPFDLLTSPGFWLTGLSVLLLGTALSGLYPAFVLSGFQPIAVLKGVLKNTGGGISLRKGLIVFQFAASIALIAGTLVVYRQLQYMRNQQLGINIDQTMVVEGAQTPIDSLYMGSFEPFKNTVLALPQVKSLTASSSVPGDEIYWTNGYRQLGTGTQSVLHTMYNIGIDEQFLSAYNLEMAAGRPFSKDIGEDKEGRNILLNQTAAKLFGYNPEGAVNQRITNGGDTLVVVGVTKDFHHQGLQKAINPVAFHFRPESRSYYSFKVESAGIQHTVAAIQEAWNARFPNDPFDYFFLDEFYNKQYQADLQFGRVFSLFALLAIFVACLGLLGLASYQILMRTKEIGIRKVLGASTSGLVGLLSKDFLGLVLASLIIAAPLAWFLMNKWLQSYAYRIDLGWGAYLPIALGAGLAAMAIAFMTVSFQSIKAALSNPVDSLRNE